MATNFETPAYGIPRRFKTPEQLHREKLEQYTGLQRPKSTGLSSFFDVPKTFGLSIASSFMSGLAGDAKSLDYVFDADITKDTEAALRGISESINAYKPAGVAAAAEKEFLTDTGALGEAWGDIYAWSDLAGSGIGSIAAMILGGGILKMLAKGGIKAMVRTGVRKKADDIARANPNITRKAAEKQARGEIDKAAEAYDTILGIGAYGTAEMAIVSGSVGHSIEQEIMRAPPELLNKSERFRDIYYGLRDTSDLNHDQSHNAARIQLSREAGIEGAKLVAIPTFVTGAVLGRYIDKAITGRMTKSTLANFAILEGVEIPVEAFQGAQEQVVQNKVYRDLLDKTRSLWAGVPDASIREALGVAFGVAPIAAVGAKSATNRQIREDGGPEPQIPGTGSFDDLDDSQQLTLIDLASKINEAKTDEVMDRTEGDPVARMAGLAEIIAKGNAADLEAAAEDEFIEIDDQAVDDFLDETAGPQVPDLDSLTDEEPEEPPAPPPAPPGPDLEGIGREIEEEGPPKPPTGPIEPPPAPPVGVEEPEPVDIGEPIDDAIHEVDFDTFRKGKSEGRFKPDETDLPSAIVALATGTQLDSTDIDQIRSLDRPELNAVGKALGIKTIRGRQALEDAIVRISNFANSNPIEEASGAGLFAREYREESLSLLENNLVTPPVKFAEGQQLGPTQILVRAQQELENKANEAYDRQQHREAIEVAVETGDFTLEDFNALPESDQAAYADIGRQLRADAAPAGEEPVPPEEPPASITTACRSTACTAANPRPCRSTPGAASRDTARATN